MIDTYVHMLSVCVYSVCSVREREEGGGRV